MKIEFITEITKGDWDCELETHSITCDGKTVIDQSEGIAPEDVLFCRDLADPFDIEQMLYKIVDAVRNGEEIQFLFVDKKND